jgi:hypothetical protein
MGNQPPAWAPAPHGQPGPAEVTRRIQIVVGRRELFPDPPADPRVRFAGQKTWIRATKEQWWQARITEPWIVECAEARPDPDGSGRIGIYTVVEES